MPVVCLTFVVHKLLARRALYFKRHYLSVIKLFFMQQPWFIDLFIADSAFILVTLTFLAEFVEMILQKFKDFLHIVILLFN